MNIYEFAENIIKAVQSRKKREQKFLTTNFDPEWRVVCLIDSGWITPDGLTAKGRNAIDKLAREVGVIQ